jgi:phytoene synthase
LSSSLEASYAYCERVARAKAKNFYYSFLVLPKAKRRAMCAVYAFMRECDDRSDEDGATESNMAAWRAELDRALAGDTYAHPLWPAFADTVRRYRIPRSYLDDMIDGVTSDLTFSQPQSFEDLYSYCYKVASVVGLTIIHIFGFREPIALAMAEKCGVAFQLTNILRDVREDRDNGRTYLPSNLMRHYAVPHLDAPTPQLNSLLADLGGRARDYFTFSRPLIKLVETDSQSSLWALIEIYDRLLRKMESGRFAVLEKRYGLSGLEKAGVLTQAFLR